MKVNMTPNPLDVVTIHASQGDTEARQWEFELHNNGELIDTSEITEQLVFKAYKGGTEQILPENTSTPTTSPFKGDIRYPQGLLSDQEFTYRQSPTEEDGLAKITDIKGNTLTWNQLVQNGNFADTSKWSQNGSGTFTVNNNEATILTNITGGGLYNIIDDYVPNHKYLYSIELKGETSHSVVIGLIPRTSVTITTSWAKYIGIIQPTNQTNNFAIYDPRSSERDNVYARNVQLIDLTKMGLGSITDPSDFTSLFPLSYYSYNQGSLLSFMGSGLKTVGKNLNPWTGVDYVASTSRTVFLKKGDYVLSTDNGNNFEGSTQIYLCLADSNGNNITSGGITSGYLYMNDSGTFYYGGYGRNNIPFTLNFDAFVSFGFNNQRPTNINEIQLEFGSTPSDYEPYTSSALSLPISTYFPNGMNGVGTDYDELTNTKATTRMARVDLGTLDYNYEQQNSRFYTSGLANVIKKQGQYDLPNIIVPNYTVRYVYQISAENNMSVGVSPTSGAVFFSNANYNSGTDFKTAMSGVYLVYPLATPIETSFTTASLVTENAEIPLSNEDGTLIGKCTEQLSAEAGFHDAKIKLADADGTCYSNKIQLHVERKPS